jgi:hypothetical protein
MAVGVGLRGMPRPWVVATNGEEEKMDPLVKPEDDEILGGGWRYFLGGRMAAPHRRHSGLRSGTHLARDGSLVYGATGGFTKKNRPPLRSGIYDLLRIPLGRDEEEEGMDPLVKPEDDGGLGG